MENGIKHLIEVASVAHLKAFLLDNALRNDWISQRIGGVSCGFPTAFARYREVDEEMKREMVSAID